MRILLYTGKGGVGKTSIAAATACKLAGMGKRVLIMSTDQAHSLGDSLGQKLGNAPAKVYSSDDKGLYAMEIDAVAESEKAWGSLKEYMKRMLTSQSGESIEVEELLVFPGFEELFSLFKILEIYQENQYDVLIVDCAPTGETMSLLKFPEMMEGWLMRILPMKRKALKVAGPIVEKAAKIPMPEDSIFDDIEYLYKKIDELRDLLLQKDIVSIRIVTTPERIVVKEAKRNFSYLHLYDMNVDAIIINKIYPRESLSGYFHKWIENQEESLRDMEESFAGIPIMHMELLKYELHTLERLEAAAEMIYGDINPMDVLFQGKIFTLEEEKEGVYRFCVNLPFLEKEDLDLLQKSDELFISIQNQYRSFVLPAKLRGKSITGAKYEDGTLNILFGLETI